MDVGNDPFPRDEVTGLAAFDHIEPVKSLNVVPPESEPRAAPADVAEAAPESDIQSPFDERRDPTLPLDLTVDQLPADPDQPIDLPVAAGAAPAPEHQEARADADRLFEHREVHDDGGFDDPDEATRVATPRTHAQVHAATLQMDWDEDEPPTQMRPDAMFDVEPVARNTGWEETENATTLYGEEPHDAEYVPPRRQSATLTMSGGRPSPFPIPPLPSSLNSDFGLSRVAHASNAVLESQRTHPPKEEAIGFLAALRAGDRRAWMVSGGAALGLIVLALIVRVVAGGPSTGTVMFAITPADAKVFVDGKEVPGTASPYALPDVSPGEHDVVVKKAGFVEYRGSFAVARGETKSLPSVELVPTVRETGFAVRSVPEGATVWVDGATTELATPARVTGVTPGIHRLQLKHPGYADFELQLFVPDATVLQLPAAQLVAAAETPKEPEPVARSARSRKSDDEDDDSARSSSRYSRSYARSSRDKDKDSSRSSYGSRSSSRSSSRDKDASASSSRSSQVLTASAPRSAAPIERTATGKLGMLRINSRPWSQVIVDGRMVGNTPQQGVPLSAGRHKVQLVNPQMGLNKTISVSIKTGQVTTQVVNLAE